MKAALAFEPHAGPAPAVTTPGSGASARVGSDLSDRVVLALADLDDARKPSDLDLPGYRLHPLKGDLKGYWSISISGNWRVTFRIEDGDAYDVGLIDYH